VMRPFLSKVLTLAVVGLAVSLVGCGDSGSGDVTVPKNVTEVSKLAVESKGNPPQVTPPGTNQKTASPAVK
jgi:hypothetical protein